MLERGQIEDALGSKVVKYRENVKYNSKLELRTVRAVIDKRSFEAPDSKWKELVSNKITCHVVRMRATLGHEDPSTDVNMTDADKDKDKAVDDSGPKRE